MKLSISHAILEGARFAHVGNFMGEEATNLPDPHTVNLEVGLMDIQDTDKAVVRLMVKSDDKSQYNFQVSYLLLLKLEPEDGDETGSKLQQQLAVTGATMLMPMVRECIANLTMRGRFGALWLPPMNFAETLQVSPEPTDAEPTPKAKRSKAKKKK